MHSQNIDLCVIGAGAAGLSVAATAAQLGLRVSVIERGKMGGECLNTGCVPSKALLAAAKTAHAIRHAKGFGIDSEPRIDFGRVHDHVHSVIAAIAPHDSIGRFEGLGVHVVQGEARFLAPRTVAVNGQEIRAQRVLIATGSEAAVPPIPGLQDVPFFTNENIFENDKLPDHLIILGAGPIGLEMAQAFRRFGAAVTVLERAKAMPKDDQELARTMLRRLTEEGIVIREGVETKNIDRDGNSIVVTVQEDGRSGRLTGSHLLVAVGRKPRVAGLGLKNAGVEYNDKGIIVDSRLRTTARGTYAVGDVIDGPKFTHVCSYHAGIVIRNALFHLPANVNYASLPWVTYTDPELAQIGMTEELAKARYGHDFRVVQVQYANNDRAQAERQPEGILKLIARRNGRILGASILGPQAGELASTWVLAIERGLKAQQIAQMIAPYPTWGELNKAVAAEFSKPKLFNATMRRVVRILAYLP